MTPVESYIAAYPAAVKQRLNTIRRCIQSTVPDAVESISYAMPAYKLKGKPLVYFAGFEHHIGFYATPAAQRAFAAELREFKQGKGSVQFPHQKPLPLKLIEKMVLYKANEINGKAPLKDKADPFAVLAAPARRALSQQGITSIKKLSRVSETQLRAMHGMGPQAIKKLKALLEENGLILKP